jgi:predicted unusual protein kinase regulating ubiquinone biosynthesis (AarF/ABC1/UbiB family)
VAVKVRRPGLPALVAFDLTVMRAVARLIALVPAARLLAPVESVDEFGRAIRAQIDLTIEAGNNAPVRRATSPAIPTSPSPRSTRRCARRGS